MYDCMMYEISQLEIGDKKNAIRTLFIFFCFFCKLALKVSFQVPESFFHAPAKQKLKGLLHKVGNRRLGCLRIPCCWLLMVQKKSTSGCCENLMDVTSGLIF